MATAWSQFRDLYNFPENQRREKVRDPSTK
jgi:hypothetical protein